MSAAPPALPSLPSLPAGLAVELDPHVRRLAAGGFLGGSPRRVMRLSPAGLAVLEELGAGRAGSEAARQLARRLCEAGLAHPRPRPEPPGGRVTVVIPVRDRPLQLADCLASLDGEVAAVVVDDGSRQAEEIARVCASHGARLVRRERGGGPAAARNSALPHLDCEFLAFLDSDCVPEPGWLERLLGHFLDPQVAAVAPRVRGLAGGGVRSRLRSALDMGGEPALVRPGARVSYVPSAALLVRRDAIGAGFDERLRYGEDVDLIWRLCEAGHWVRYDPSVSVGHREPSTTRALLARRFRYGSSAADLAARHGDACAPALVPARRLAPLALLAARRPAAAAMLWGADLAATAGRARAAGLTRADAVGLALSGEAQLAVSWGSYLTGAGLPLAVAAAAASRRARAPTAAAAGAAVVAATRRPGRRGPAEMVTGFAEGGAYGLGVWWGCLDRRSLRALVPAIR